MSINYVDDIYMDLGEKTHMVSLVRPVCGEEIPFEIRAARWELYREDWEKGDVVLEAEGECTVNGHALHKIIMFLYFFFQLLQPICGKLISRHDSGQTAYESSQ